MKYFNSLFLCGLLTVLISVNALSQEKEVIEDSNKHEERFFRYSADSHSIIFQISPGKRSDKAEVNNPPVIADLKLDKAEIIFKCSPPKPSKEFKLQNNSLINVFTDATDPEDDMLLYQYEISGGKVIGQGQKVIWDLTGVKPGDYTIKASADDGCGFCGNIITKTVTVK